jgi:HlyD family secretion protein
MKNYLPANGLLALALLAFAGCSPQRPSGYQGYLEGELERLNVQKGSQVTAGKPLFALEQGAELAALREAAARVRSAQARLADLRKGQRPSELATMEARLAQAQAAAELAGREYERTSRLYQTKVASDDDHDRARLSYESANQQVTELTALLETARLGARSDVIAAAEADAASAQAAVDRAGWSVAQKSITAPRDGLVYDTLYREGEFVTAAAPVVALLPAENIKVRFFVPEAEFGVLKLGATVKVGLTGGSAPLDARISYLSPKPEYTPPILYNRENRAKLVFMVEAVFDPAVARDLHPGQPVDVSLNH